MGFDTPDWQQPSTIASGVVQVAGAALTDEFPDTATPADQSWVVLTPTAGRNVAEWLLVNPGDVALHIGHGRNVRAFTLEGRESITVIWNGPIHARSATAAVGALDATAFEVS